MKPIGRLCIVFFSYHIWGYLVACNGYVTSYHVLAMPKAPTNISLAQIFATAAIIRWEANVTDPLTRFEMTVTPISPPSTASSPHETTPSKVFTFDVDGSQRSHHLRELTAETEYEVYLVTVNTRGRSNLSDVITFKTLPEGTEMHRLNVNPGEVTIVVFVLCAWFCAIALFLHKWGKIRISTSSEPRYKHAPKNLDTIKVVKKPSDSVIYKTHPKDSLYSRTMDARMKRIERMNTMPNIKVDMAEKAKDNHEDNGKSIKDKEKNKPDPKSRKFERVKTEPAIQMETTFSKEKEKRRKDLFKPPPPVVEVEEAMGSSQGSMV